jgi:SpoVK/Ycf46/Vps4 family AAA+-type ATPase
MGNKKISSTITIAKLIPKLVEAGFVGNSQRLELLSLNAIRSFRVELPEMAEELGSLLAKFAANGTAMRFHAVEPPPTDVDAGLALMRIHSADSANEPILNTAVNEVVERFLRERLESERLLREGFGPPRTLLLKGAPGTGKTMLAYSLARKLNLPLVVLDLATSISSFLGKTGSNLRRSLDYARAKPCVLLLDEFDAIGKRRDDVTEVGELKRIVNVLLKELEEWPMHSVLVAATNHPELLDPAIHRRFDVVIQIPLPGDVEREAIIRMGCGHFAGSLPKNFITAISKVLTDRNGSELNSLAQSAVRRHVVEKAPLASIFVQEIERLFSGSLPKQKLGTLAKSLQQAAGLSVREIAALVGKSSSTVQYHLTKKEACHA